MSICVSLSDLIMSKHLLYWALSDCSQGEFSKTFGPIVVRAQGNKYILIDGYHRLIELMMVWKRDVVCMISETENREVGEDDLFKFVESDRFCGLEILSDTAHLEDVFCRLTAK